MDSSDKWDNRFLEMAKLISTWSKDPSTKTGAVIVDPNRRIVSVGFNGFPRNMPDDEVFYIDREQKYSRIIHCEVNALLFAKQNKVEGCTLYTWPFLSCDRCFVQMAQAGIVRFVAPEPTQDKHGRWGISLHKTRTYAKEMNLEIKEVRLW